MLRRHCQSRSSISSTTLLLSPSSVSPRSVGIRQRALLARSWRGERKLGEGSGGSRIRQVGGKRKGATHAVPILLPLQGENRTERL
eukprot:64385-Rhodomonas_salina.1